MRSLGRWATWRTSQPVRAGNARTREVWRLPHALRVSVCLRPCRAGRGIRLDAFRLVAPGEDAAARKCQSSRATSACLLDARRRIARLRRPILASIASSQLSGAADRVRAMRRFPPGVPAPLRIGSRYRARSGNIRRHCLACCGRRPNAGGLSSPSFPTVGREDAPRPEHCRRRSSRPVLHRSSHSRATYIESLSSRTTRRGPTMRCMESRHRVSLESGHLVWRLP